MSQWSCKRGAASAPKMRRLPDMPRCRISVPVSKTIKMYLARRSMRRTVRSLIDASKWRSMGQRRRRSRTMTLMTRRPIRAGAMPRRVVSTSGSSGTIQALPVGLMTARGGSRSKVLLDLRFFVGDVLARHRIEFLGFHLVGMEPLVLRGGVVMPGSGRRDQLDFIAHAECSLNLDALGAEVGNDHVHAALLDGAQAARRHPQAHKSLLGFQPKSMSVQIGQKAATLAIVRMGYRITRFRAFARDLADSRHGVKPSKLNT